MNARMFVGPAIGTALLLTIPLVKTFLDRHKPDGEGMRWGLLDFAVMGVLLFGAGVTYTFVASKLDARIHRIAVGFAILCVVFAIWVELAVGGVSKLVAFATG
ncbi:MAG: hypothetical protein ACOY82_16840 [Pseudomonadota bacterium]